jgi:hypothetical protein
MAAVACCGSGPTRVDAQHPFGTAVLRAMLTHILGLALEHAAWHWQGRSAHCTPLSRCLCREPWRSWSWAAMFYSVQILSKGGPLQVMRASQHRTRLR